ncbi:MAG: SDR family NAD(P)-dependent oxidoreductase, partial [Gammaproteobacteria bacterium]
MQMEIQSLPAGRVCVSVYTPNRPRYRRRRGAACCWCGLLLCGLWESSVPPLCGRVPAVSGFRGTFSPHWRPTLSHHKKPGGMRHMTSKIDRRFVLRAGSAFAAASMLPRSLTAGDLQREDIARSAYGFATTCDEVAAGSDLAGKTVLITGCNSGLGYESMRTFAAHGAHVIGTGRTMEKAQVACDSVAGKTTPLVCELTD